MLNWRKIIHFFTTAWFVAAVFYLLVTALRERGLNWWLIFSLSGYSLFIVLILLSLYLFALYKGAMRKQDTEPEHPLTRTDAYMIFYDICPLLGALAGATAIVPEHSGHESLSIISYGTFLVTFLVWVIVDPAVSLIEQATPKSRQFRAQRIERTRKEKIRHQKQQHQLILELTEKEQHLRQLYNEKFSKQADELSRILDNFDGSDKKQRTRIIEIGLDAFKQGGTACMQQLHKMAKANKNNKSDYVSVLWNGIGTWTLD